jgi:hypothetical protein
MDPKLIGSVSRTKFWTRLFIYRLQNVKVLGPAALLESTIFRVWPAIKVAPFIHEAAYFPEDFKIRKVMN